MCGILGAVGRNGPRLTPAAFRRALNLMKHRGPDDEGYLLFDAHSGQVCQCRGADTDGTLSGRPFVESVNGEFDVLLGHRRLAVLDVSPAGHQPMATPDGRFWIVLNGEIYNFLELRQQLEARGYTFRTETDTEVVLAAYCEWGPSMLQRFEGMFALGILDVSDGTVFLARDAFGIKPLYFARSASIFFFSSEISPLLSLVPSAQAADPEGVYQYMRLGLTDGFSGTMFAGIQQLPAAHYALIHVDGTWSSPIRPFWIPGAVPRRTVPLEEAAQELAGLLDKSVRLHLRSDVPLGTCLSGGLDSTAIAASMRRNLGPAAAIHSFSFESDDPRTGEGAFVEIAAQKFGLLRHSVSPNGDNLVSDLEDLVRIQEQPFASTSIYAQYCVFRSARQAGMTVMLDGQGADELFGGYASAVSAQLTASLLRGRLGSLRSLARSSHVSAPGARKRMILSAGGRLLPKRLVAPFMSLVGEPLYPKWLSRSWFRTHGHFAESRAQGRGRNALREELLHFLTNLSLPQLLRYEDRNSMAFSIESRVPFCTIPLADFAFSLPQSLLVGLDGETKAVLRHAVRETVPRPILERPKVGFETPESSWVRALAPTIQNLMSTETFRSLPFINHEIVDSDLREQLGSGRPIRPMVWRLLNVALWAEQFNVAFPGD